MKKLWKTLLIAIFASLFPVTLAFSQIEGLSLRLSRDFGYGGFNNDIQGLFTMKVSGPETLLRVVFFIDDKVIGEITQAPFNLQFNTDNFPTGKHELYAVGYSSAGQEYRSNVITSNFVPASEGTKAAMKFAIPLLVIVFGAILLSFVVPLLIRRGKNQELALGVERKYRFGGGVCPKCHRPFAFPFLSLHLGFNKLVICPYCGKWSGVKSLPLEKLRDAEKRELEWGKSEVHEESDEEKLSKELDDSKYQGV